MRTIVLFFIVSSSCVCGQNNGPLSKLLGRRKRDATGALDIVTNHAQPIHADVKHDSGAVNKVTPPKDSIYQGQSLRKSLPRTTGLDLLRAVSRVVALLTLLFSGVVEFYPLVHNLYCTVRDFMYPNK